MAFRVTRNPNPVSPQQRADILAKPGFGRYFTDHMVRIDWTLDTGWQTARCCPTGR